MQIEFGSVCVCRIQTRADPCLGFLIELARGLVHAELSLEKQKSEGE